MKTTIKLLFVGSIALAATSCSDFLETEPRTQIAETEFYKTEDDMMKGLYAVMNEMQIRMPEVFSYSSLLSDESETGGGIGEGSYKTKWDTFSYDPNSCFGAWGYGSWWNEWDYGLFNGVVAANLLIDKLDGCSLDKSFVNQISAEAKFYRAFFYYYLFMGYEQFPLLKHTLAASEMYTVPKGTRQEIYDFMMSDLTDDIINALPERANTKQGRVCRDAARVLRANSGEGFGLARSFGGRNIVDPRSAEQGGLLEGYGQNTMPSTIYKMFAEGDTRREGTVITYADEAKKVEDLVRKGELPEGSKFSVSEQQENYEGLGHYKLHPRKETASAVNPSDNYFNSWRIYRYADVLLLATELEARINGSVGTDGQGYFDQVRDRAFQDRNHRISLSGKSKQEILDILFKERGYEFIDEMQRWFDILRFDKGTEILGSKGWTEKYRYFPIDQSEIDRSQGGLTQNPGWK